MNHMDCVGPIVKAGGAWEKSVLKKKTETNKNNRWINDINMMDVRAKYTCKHLLLEPQY